MADRCDAVSGGAETETSLPGRGRGGGATKTKAKAARSTKTARARKAAARAEHPALRPLTTRPDECSEVLDRRPGEPCSSARVVAGLLDFVRAAGPPAATSEARQKTTNTRSGRDDGALPSAESAGASAVRAAARLLGCDSESCVVTHPAVREHIAAAAARGTAPLPPHALALELGIRFKPKGPRSSTRLLSNFNLDEVLQQWAAARRRFYNFGFNMIDFEAVGGSLARTDAAMILEGRESQNLGRMGGNVRRPCDIFACIVNTDVSTGRGKHWVAVLGDCRGQAGEPWSVEYFNSAGNPPPRAITNWLEATAARLAEHRERHPRRFGAGPVATEVLTDVRHQRSQTECGLYCLYFIRRRLEGGSAAEFRGARIPDAAMTAFRRHVFRAS